MKIDIHIKWDDLKVNRVVRYFVLTDLVFFGGWGLITPIFAVFVLDVKGATLITIGAVSALYWVVKSLVQIPVALYLDRHAGEKDDFYALLFSLVLAGFSAMAFLSVRTIGGLFLVQFIYSVALGFYTPSWTGIFSRHVDKNQYSFSWSLDSTAVGLAYGVTALVGGAIANFFGFQAVFVFVAVLSFASAFLLFSVPNLVLPKPVSKDPLIRDHGPAGVGK